MIHIRAARPVDLPAIAAVLQEAFSDKLRIIFGRQPAKIRAVLEAALAGPVQRGYDGILVAEREGRIIGTLTIEPMYYTPRENRTFEHLSVRELGLLRMLWAAYLLWLIGHTPEAGDAHVGDVGVAPDCQGEGVGQLLLEHAETWAYDHERQRLTLWVAESNERALYVYDKAGFSIVETRSSLLTRLFFGVRRWHFMAKSLVSETDAADEMAEPDDRYDAYDTAAESADVYDADDDTPASSIVRYD